MNESRCGTSEDNETADRVWETPFAGALLLGLSGAVVALAARGESAASLSTWIWLSLWAPAAGCLAARWQSSWFGLVPLFIWAVALGSGLAQAADPLGGTAAVAALYLLGFSTTGETSSTWGRAAGWLMAGGLLSALPSGAGIWVQSPDSTWVASALNVSPVVWVCENAGFDWMRHESVYEAAGAGDLSPQERLGWGTGSSAWVALGITLLVAGLRRAWSRVVTD